MRAEAHHRLYVGRLYYHATEEEAGFANTRASARRHDKVSERIDRRPEQDGRLRRSRAYCGSRDPARRRQHDHAEDNEGSKEDEVDLGLHNYAKGGQQSYAEYAGSKSGGIPADNHKTGGGERKHELAEDGDALETAGAHPSPNSQLRRENHRD